jgi:hypothetical protein
MNPRIAQLKEAVETAHKCTARHVESKPVLELFRGQLWDGAVEAFELAEHPIATRCYAWTYLERGEQQVATVLEIPPIDSAEAAIRSANAVSGINVGWRAGESHVIGYIPKS